MDNTIEITITWPDGQVITDWPNGVSIPRWGEHFLFDDEDWMIVDTKWELRAAGEEKRSLHYHIMLGEEEDEHDEWGF